MERASVLAEIAQLEAESGAGEASRIGASVDVSTADGRVALFASLFRGRTDVFATRWESRRQPGRSGWSPRCANEWVQGVCEKPRVKCGACTKRRFLPVTRAELRAHLEGRQTVGIYPLLMDETCWLLAIDLDGDGWREDVAAVREAADAAGVPVLVERSRSGDGAHLWVLFSSPVPARVARGLGEWLLTEAMRSRALAISSYDRLFPNQDTMPAGGFGNLIALPLQRGPRHAGFSELLDHALEPYPDQWTYLAGAERFDAQRCHELVADAQRSGTTLAVGRWDAEPGTPGQDALPAPSGNQPQSHRERHAADQRVPSVSGMPGTSLARPVVLSVAGRVSIDVRDVAGEVRARLRRTAAFANPMFFEKQRARLSTHGTPRVIACHEEHDGRLWLPRGCLDHAREALVDAGHRVEVRDERIDGRALDVAFGGTLRPGQDRAVRSMAEHDIGVLVAPPGAGKTVMGAALIARRQVSTLVLVHRRPLQAQWIDRLVEQLGVERRSVGTLAAQAAPSPSGIDVVTVQTLARRKDVVALLGVYGQVIVDECHHVGAVSIEELLREAPARYVLGLTATPRRRDGHHPIVAMQCGPVRHTMVEPVPVDRRPVRRVAVERRTAFDPGTLPIDPGVQEVLSAIARDEARTALIVSDVVEQVGEGRFPLVLTERRTHLDALAEGLGGAGIPAVVLHGGMGVRARRVADEILGSGEPRVVVATGRFVGEGFDDPRLDTLVLALPVAWRGTVVQYAGRLHRGHEDKHEVRILDYVDHDVGVLRRMFAKRQKAYRSIGYEIR